MTSDQLKQWQSHMQYTQKQAASALGMSLATYCDLRRGIYRNSGKPVVISRTVELACVAIFTGYTTWDQRLFRKVQIVLR